MTKSIRLMQTKKFKTKIPTKIFRRSLVIPREGGESTTDDNVDSPVKPENDIVRYFTGDLMSALTF